MRDDGTWSIWFEGPPDLSTSIEAYVALRMCGVDPGPRALAYIQRDGGIREGAALHEVLSRARSASGRGSGWCRSRPSSCCCRPPRRSRSTTSRAGRGRRSSRSRSRSRCARCAAPTSTCATSARSRVRRAAAPGPNALRRKALQRAETWMRERQEADGSWGGIQPPWVWGIIALDCARPRRSTTRRCATRSRGWERLHGRRRRPAATRGVPVAGVGHRARRARAARVRRLARPSAAARRRRLPARARRSRCRATGRSAVRTSRPAAGRSSTRTTSIPTPTTRP